MQDGIPVDSPQEEGEDYPSGHMYDEVPDSTIVESVSTSSPSKMPSATVVTTALDNAEANLDAETQGSSDPEDTTDPTVSMLFSSSTAERNRTVGGMFIWFCFV